MLDLRVTIQHSTCLRIRYQAVKSVQPRRNVESGHFQNENGSHLVRTILKTTSIGWSYKG